MSSNLDEEFSKLRHAVWDWSDKGDTIIDLFFDYENSETGRRAPLVNDVIAVVRAVTKISEQLRHD